MPVTKAGESVKAAMKEQYGEEKGARVFYASENKGIPGSEKWTKRGGGGDTGGRGRGSATRDAIRSLRRKYAGG